MGEGGAGEGEIRPASKSAGEGRIHLASRGAQREQRGGRRRRRGLFGEWAARHPDDRITKS
jgi:hypothetical protein